MFNNFFEVSITFVCSYLVSVLIQIPKAAIRMRFSLAYFILFCLLFNMTVAQMGDGMAGKDKKDDSEARRQKFLASRKAKMMSSTHKMSVKSQADALPNTSTANAESDEDDDSSGE